jgi:hypothetical protein
MNNYLCKPAIEKKFRKILIDAGKHRDLKLLKINKNETSGKSFCNIDDRYLPLKNIAKIF